MLIARSCSSQRSPGLVPHSSTLGHEEIASFCLRSDVFGGQAGYEQAEGEWAQSEVGEGVEEVWERSVSLPSVLGCTMPRFDWPQS